MRDVYIADRDVGHLTERTNVSAARSVLVLGGEQNAVTGLAEATPAIFHEIRLDEHANRILQLQVILDDEGIAVRSADEAGVAFHPLPRFPEVIVQDLDVGGGEVAAPQPNMTASPEACRKLFWILKGPSWVSLTPPATACESVHDPVIAMQWKSLKEES